MLQPTSIPPDWPEPENNYSSLFHPAQDCGDQLKLEGGSGCDDASSIGRGGELVTHFLLQFKIQISRTSLINPHVRFLYNLSPSDPPYDHNFTTSFFTFADRPTNINRRAVKRILSCPFFIIVGNKIIIRSVCFIAK